MPLLCLIFTVCFPLEVRTGQGVRNPLLSPLPESKNSRVQRRRLVYLQLLFLTVLFSLFGGDDLGPQSAAKRGRQFEVLLLSPV